MSLAVVEFVVEPISMFETLFIHLPHVLSMPGKKGEVGWRRGREGNEKKKRGEGIEMGFSLLFT